MIENKNTLILATQKSTGKTRMGEDTMRILQAGGLSFARAERVDLLTSNVPGLQLFEMKNGDLATSIRDCEADLAFMGRDQAEEYAYGEYLALKDLGYSRCVIKLGVRNGLEYIDPLSLTDRTVATSVPNITRRFFKDTSVRIKKYEGGCESRVLAGFADACVEVTESGQSMRANDMYVAETVLESSAILAASLLLPEKMRAKLRVERIVWRLLRDIMTGYRQTQFVMLAVNAPASCEADIVSILSEVSEAPNINTTSKPGVREIVAAVPTTLARSLSERLLAVGGTKPVWQKLDGAIPDINDPDINQIMRQLMGSSWHPPAPKEAFQSLD